MNILFAEDMANHSALYASLMREKRNHKVTVEALGSRATDQVRAIRPDLVVMDIRFDQNQPQMNGELLVFEWRRSENSFLKAVPVMILTSYVDPEEAERNSDRDWPTKRIFYCSKSPRDIRQPVEFNKTKEERFLACLDKISFLIESAN